MNEIAVTQVYDDKDVTFAVVNVGGRSATGHAKVCEPDKFDSEIGRKLALGRALRKLGRELVGEAYDEVHENDKEREKQEAATRKGLEYKRETDRRFQEEFAILIEALHPGTFNRVIVRSDENTKLPLLEDFKPLTEKDIARWNLPG